MTRSRIACAAVALIAITAAAFGAYWIGMTRGMKMASPAVATQDAAAANGRKVLYWHDPMVPNVKFDKPGKSPFMDMQLVPVYAGNSEDGTVSISPRVEQNLGIRTVEATRAPLGSVLEVVGNVAFNERELEVVQARANGFVERLFVRAPLDRVAKGAPLAEVLVPDWVAAQEEFLAVRRMSDAGVAGLADSARQRMRLAGMSDAQIATVDRTGEVRPRLTLVAPRSGVVTELTAREGMTIMAGAPLFRINGLDTVWVNAEIPESAAARVKPGYPITARASAFPGEVFAGKIGALLPEVSAATRTIRARIELSNPGAKLAPGMFVTVSLEPPARESVVQVPSEAVIVTGKRKVVIVAERGSDGQPRFRPVDVETGTESNEMTEIRKGIEAGTKVVASGQFLIDSEASLKATETRLAPAQAAAQKAAPVGNPQAHHGVGKVEKVNADSVTISHGPIASMHWPAMTMDFIKPPQGLSSGVKPGVTVDFEFVQAPQGSFVLRSIIPEPAAGGTAK